MFYNKGIQEDDAIWTILEVWTGFFQELEGNIIEAFLKNNKEKEKNKKTIKAQTPSGKRTSLSLEGKARGGKDGRAKEAEIFF